MGQVAVLTAVGLIVPGGRESIDRRLWGMHCHMGLDEGQVEEKPVLPMLGDELLGLGDHPGRGILFGRLRLQSHLA